MKILSALCVSLGIILMVSAFVYPRTVKTESLWSEEQALERIRLGYAVHDLTCDHSQGQHEAHTHADNEQGVNETLRQYEKIQSELVEARERPQRIAAILKWLGIGATVLGVGGYYAARESD